MWGQPPSAVRRAVAPLSFPKHDPRPHICHPELLPFRIFVIPNFLSFELLSFRTFCHSESASFADEESAVVRQHRIPRPMNPRPGITKLSNGPMAPPTIEVHVLP